MVPIGVGVEGNQSQRGGQHAFLFHGHDLEELGFDGGVCDVVRCDRLGTNSVHSQGVHLGHGVFENTDDHDQLRVRQRERS